MKTEKPLLLKELRAIRHTVYEKTGVLLKQYLAEQAFTRSSYANLYGGESNENLEFIGDTVLGYHVVRKLCARYATLKVNEGSAACVFRAHEKDLTALKSGIVSNATLAAIMNEWDLCRFLIVGRSDVDNRIDSRQKIKADLFEAIIGAIVVQCDWNTEVLDNVISRALPMDRLIEEYEKAQSRLPEFGLENAVNTLKELAEHGKCPFPEYDSTGPDKLGYDKNGDPLWACTLRIAELDLIKTVFAKSKRDAKKCCAYLALCEIYEHSNEYGPNARLLNWKWDGRRLVPDTDREF